MNSTQNIYELFGEILSYPTSDYHSRVEKCQKAIANADISIRHRELTTGLRMSNDEIRNPKSKIQNHVLDETASLFDSFVSFVNEKSIHELEEHFTQTFDINPVSCLEVGWHLFGESYDRGAFLVRMRELLRQFNIKESTELPDHITHVLAALGKMEKNDADEFANAQVLPAIKKMLDGFEGKENPYENVLRALQIFIQENHAQEESNSFIGKVFSDNK